MGETETESGGVYLRPRGPPRLHSCRIKDPCSSSRVYVLTFRTCTCLCAAAQRERVCARLQPQHSHSPASSCAASYPLALWPRFDRSSSIESLPSLYRMYIYMYICVEDGAQKGRRNEFLRPDDTDVPISRVAVLESLRAEIKFIGRAASGRRMVGEKMDLGKIRSRGVANGRRRNWKNVAACRFRLGRVSRAGCLSERKNRRWRGKKRLGNRLVDEGTSEWCVALDERDSRERSRNRWIGDDPPLFPYFARPVEALRRAAAEVGRRVSRPVRWPFLSDLISFRIHAVRIPDSSVAGCADGNWTDWV